MIEMREIITFALDGGARGLVVTALLRGYGTAMMHNDTQVHLNC